MEEINVKNINNTIGKVIAIMSGKGGVGKSTVTSLVASTLQQQGYKVGVLDADITGPSIPKIFGVEDFKAYQNQKGIIPAKTSTGIKIMSLNLLMDNKEEAVIWRGPILGNTVKQFYEDVYWGTLDYLVIDLPPGTSDVTLTAMQSLDIDGVFVVSSPQDLVQLIVNKSINMANKMNVDIYGLIENMSYFNCSSCGEKHHIFGKSKINKISKDKGLDIIGQLPIDENLTILSDQGKIEQYTKENEYFNNDFCINLLNKINK